MKKMLVMLMTFCLSLGAANAAELSKAQVKAMNKEMKAKIKEYKKENWKIFGSTRTLEGALTDHYTKLISQGDEAAEYVGTASRFKSKNVGHQQALNNGINSYAQQAGSTLKGRLVADMRANGSADDVESPEFDNFYAAYERLVEKEIRNEMRESFSIIRDLGNGEFEMQTFFIVDENTASKARIRAMENAEKESEAAQRHATKIVDFVRQGFDK